MLLFIHISIRDWRAQDATTFGGCWNGLGLFIALMAIVEFVTEVLRFEGLSQVFGMIALLYGAINRLFLIPYWICVLGYGLDRASAKQAYSDGGELALTEMNTANAATTSTNPFEIGGDDDDADDVADLGPPTTPTGGVSQQPKKSPPPAAFGN